MSQFRCLFGGLAITLLAGCRSHNVEVTIVNRGPAVHVLEFDYPNASFGANQLAQGASYHYSVQVKGDGPISLQYEDAAGKNHSATGPQVHKDQEGQLLVSIDTSGAVSFVK